jgi:hypothetical protein
MLAGYALRRNRSGRVLIAARDNQQAAPAYGINLVRTRLAAFAVSGAFAGIAGVLATYLQHQVVADSFSVLASVQVFLVTVIGGLTSIGFAVAGAVLLEFLTLFGPRYYHFLGQNMITVMPIIVTGPLLILTLYFIPGGLAQAGFGWRDTFLRRVARRRNLLVPSLVADRRVQDDERQQEATIVEQVERRVVGFGASASLLGPSITCPVCDAELALHEAPLHEHLRSNGALAGRQRNRPAAHRAGDESG